MGYSERAGSRAAAPPKTVDPAKCTNPELPSLSRLRLETAFWSRQCRAATHHLDTQTRSKLPEAHPDT
eukprot:scaffold1131_cov229-Pinguiococcus_pyrenoidosus.AAC.2